MGWSDLLPQILHIEADDIICISFIISWEFQQNIADNLIDLVLLVIQTLLERKVAGKWRSDIS
jgi:hypothetical protein